MAEPLPLPPQALDLKTILETFCDTETVDVKYVDEMISVLANSSADDYMAAIEVACGGFSVSGEPNGRLWSLIAATNSVALHVLLSLCPSTHGNAGSAPLDMSRDCNAALGMLSTVLVRLTLIIYPQEGNVPSAVYTVLVATSAIQSVDRALTWIAFKLEVLTAEHEDGWGMIDTLLRIASACLTPFDLFVDERTEDMADCILDASMAIGHIIHNLEARWMHSDRARQVGKSVANALLTILSKLSCNDAYDLLNNIAIRRYFDFSTLFSVLDCVCGQLIDIGHSFNISSHPMLKQQCSSLMNGLTIFLHVIVSLYLNILSMSKSHFYLHPQFEPLVLNSYRAFVLKCELQIQKFFSIVFNDLKLRDNLFNRPYHPELRSPEDLEYVHAFDGTVLSFFDVVSRFSFYDLCRPLDEWPSRQLLASLLEPTYAFSSIFAMGPDVCLSCFWESKFRLTHVLFNVLESAFPDPTSMAQYVRQYEPELMRILLAEVSLHLAQSPRVRRRMIDRFYVLAPYLSEASRQRLHHALCAPTSDDSLQANMVFDIDELILEEPLNPLWDLSSPLSTLFAAARLGTLLRATYLHKADPTMHRMLPSVNCMTDAALEFMRGLDKTAIDAWNQRLEEGEDQAAVLEPPVPGSRSGYWAMMLHSLLRFEEAYPTAFRGPTVQSSLATLVLYLGRLLRAAEREAARELNLAGQGPGAPSSSTASAKPRGAVPKKGPTKKRANMSARERLQLQLAQREEARLQAAEKTHAEQLEAQGPGPSLKAVRELRRLLRQFAGRLRAAVDAAGTPESESES